ncbi:Transmembrane domain-containing protein [Orpheovirus IHUMI-LCC2]|uniref:Transmembrane domain-containing protein n=1 Tax=Orpheovirus IHUMI-LCC2 TaxID=2023057 RepID=A0A2I2L5I1_9VIRU|nr:Transmembrane domain-containing protein [Orpheovirus IHUMI-LCC2]SNW62787.1 Transmembrane domain-containing protein [Orpheovirus IHUMI-LCC2]
MSCQPRFIWQDCPSDDHFGLRVFYYSGIVSHATVFILYGIILLHHQHSNIKKKVKFNLNYGNGMRLMILAYSFFGLLTCISNTFSYPIFELLPTEIFLNFLFVGIFGTLMLLLQYWIGLSEIIAGKLRPGRQMDVLKIGKNLANVMFSRVLLVNLVVMVVSDVLMIYLPKSTNIIITIQMSLWGANCLVIGVLMGYYGYQVSNFLADTKDDALNLKLSTTGSRLYIRFRILYISYIILSVPYAGLYATGIILTVWNYSVVAFYVVYGLFHGAGLITALITLPLIGPNKEEKDRKKHVTNSSHSRNTGIRDGTG